MINRQLRGLPCRAVLQLRQLLLTERQVLLQLAVGLVQSEASFLVFTQCLHASRVRLHHDFTSPS